MQSVGYDNLLENADILLDLPFEEGSGSITRDLAKPHHNDVTFPSAPTWTSLASGTGVLDFNGTANYGELDSANCADLNFTTDSYAFTCWINWEISSTASQILLGRYEIDVSGWEIYLTSVHPIYYLTLRHHHAGGTATRTACYSVGWNVGRWWFLGINRVGLYPKMYRNGRSLSVTSSVGGVQNPETCAEDLVIGCRHTKNSDWYKNQMCRPRMWSGGLSELNMYQLFMKDKSRFGL